MVEVVWVCTRFTVVYLLQHSGFDVYTCFTIVYLLQHSGFDVYTCFTVVYLLQHSGFDVYTRFTIVYLLQHSGFYVSLVAFWGALLAASLYHMHFRTFVHSKGFLYTHIQF